MRIYEVNYAHIKQGENFCRINVAVRGFVPEAISKANKSSFIAKWKGALRVESVRLIASA